MDSNDALLAAIVYASLFQFPLTREELQIRAIGKIVQPRAITELLMSHAHITIQNEFIGLTSSKVLINRRDRHRWSQKKRARAVGISKWLCFIPTILFIGISGSVAADNAEETDDIDLFIITKRDTLWTTRFFILIVLSLFGARKQSSTNLFCLNMLLDESHMKIPIVHQDIYTAYELLQLDPLFDRNNTYEKLFERNEWFTMLLPNFMRDKKTFRRVKNTGSAGIFFRKCEFLFARLQKSHLRKVHIPIPKDDGVLRFHNSLTRTKILASFEAELRENHLDKVVGFLYTRN